MFSRVYCGGKSAASAKRASKFEAVAERKAGRRADDAPTRGGKVPVSRTGDESMGSATGKLPIENGKASVVKARAKSGNSRFPVNLAVHIPIAPRTPVFTCSYDRRTAGVSPSLWRLGWLSVLFLPPSCRQRSQRRSAANAALSRSLLVACRGEQEGVKFACRVLIHSLRDVRVYIQRCGHIRMTEPCLHDLWTDTGLRGRVFG